MAGYLVKVRSGARVRRERASDLDGALELLERHARALEQAPPAPAVAALSRHFEPVQRVVGRVELRGPGRRWAGVDVRGDGSSEAYTGRVLRKLVSQRDGEDAYAALRRVLAL